MEEIRICFTGGSTGGHFYPLLFTLRELKKIAQERNLNLKYFYVGVEPLERKTLEEEGVKIYVLPSFKIRRYFSLENFIDIFIKMPLAFLLSFIYIFKIMPDVLFSKGGTSAFPPVFVSWLFRIPILIHESDSIPGWTNMVSSRFATKVALAFEFAKKFFKNKEVLVVGQPIDERIIYTPISKEDYERFGLNPDEYTILILGGAQGSQFLNDLIVECLPELLKFSQVVHITGKKFFQETYSFALGKIRTSIPLREKSYKAFPFLKNEDLLILMKIADLVISRAGSGTIFEISALGKPSILIPLPEDVVGGHQKENAFIYSKTGAAYFLEEKNAKPHLLLFYIKEILTKEEIKEKMKEAALKFYKPGSAKKLAEELIILAKRG
jgi:UDP-N-acetylglucosamine--N-acetylmuramyl-(pentapeptide) pyrophosphoryl-undecaprenol N-acetylglucosamine transferase